MGIRLDSIQLNGRMKFGPLNFAPTYLITPNSVSINEGDIVTFTVTTTNVPDGTVLYWSASGTATSADFTDNAMSGSFTITASAGVITRTLTNDLMTEGSENLYINVRTDSTVGTVVASSAMVVIGDTSFISTDPVFNYVSLLLNGDGANGATNNTFVDSSPNAFTVTRVGTPTQGSFSPFSDTGWSGHFNGSARINSPANAAFAYGTGDYTMEAWIYPTSMPNAGMIFDTRTGAGNGVYLTVNTNLTVTAVLNSQASTSTATVSLNAWSHIALVRQGSTVKAYLNGTQIISAVNSNNITDNNCYIGCGFDNIGYFNGYISNARVVKGTALYTTAFTPSTTQLTAIANTSLLTLQSNRFIDNSTNNFAITSVNTKIAPNSPFLPTNAYSPVTNGGSMSFNGVDQRATIPYSPLFNAGLGDSVTPFTIEAWFYCNSLPSVQAGIVERYKNSGSGWSLVLQSSGLINANQQGNVATITGTTVVRTGTWNHVALSGSLNSWRLFLNGVQQGATFTAYVDSGQDAGIAIGALAGAANFFNGYITGVRYTSSNIYTANFTPSTAPLTAIANTQLLVNGSNGAIVDLSSKNGVTTISSTRVSTAQKKFGTASILFNGTTDYLRVPNTPAVDTSRGDFTIEMWIYKVANNANTSRLWNPDGDTFDSIALGVNASGVLTCTSTTASGSWNVVNASFGGTLNNNQWYHVALVRSGANIYGFVNGVQTVLSTTCPTVLYNAVTANKVIGGQSGVARMFNGYIDDFRITKGVARYTAAFTPPTTAFPLQ